MDIGGLGGAGGSKEIASFEFDDLLKTYDHFAHPIAEVTIDGQDFGDNKSGLSISNIRVELSCGFEASLASFSIYNVFDDQSAQFRYDSVKQYVQLGSTVVIYLGYKDTPREVFRGFIAKVNFQYERDEMPAIMVTALDVKGIMMSNRYSKQLKAKSFSGAIKEILNQAPYSEMISPEALQAAAAGGLGGAGALAGAASAAGGAKPADNTHSITKLSVSNTPDAKDETPGAGAGGAGGGLGGGGLGGAGGAQPSADGRIVQTEDTYTVEMVGESDYEFTIKAAKRFNFEFFILGGELIFRPAKSDTSTLMVLSPATMVQSIDLEYDITGLVGSVTVRNVNAGQGKIISSNKSNKNKIGNKAKQMISGLKKVYIDPTVDSKNDADYRANYLLEDMAYRFGTVQLDIVGLPELVPGKFIKLNGMGKNVDNKYYIVSTTHTMDRDGSYNTRIIGKAAEV